MPPFFDPRRAILGAARRLVDPDEAPPAPGDRPPRLTAQTLGAAPAAPPRVPSPAPTTMSRSRDKILTNLDEMYREAFERAKVAGDTQQMTTLDFAYRREQLYFEILLDVRDAVERRG
ncbi:hypothetical protein tb265_23930 [Gemmatimonadetes bacterium T265]|nr:hypothetical protein tb265_23930 [Gemmatimonadetes bacterium T265]